MLYAMHISFLKKRRKEMSKFSLLLVSILFIFSCGKKAQEGIEEGLDSVPSNPGVENVSDKDGGPGFEKIAESLGYKTRKCTNFSSPNAKKGGVLKLAISEYPATFRVLGKESNEVTISLIQSLLYDSLLGYSSYDKDFCTGLGTHWKFEEPTKDYVFTAVYVRIDPNARWSDGMPVTADDVVASWKLKIDEGIADPYENSFSKNFLFEKITPYIVKITAVNEEVKKDWKQRIYSVTGVVLPAHYISTVSGADYLEKYNKEFIPGTGAYQILPDGLKQDDYIIETRNENWWAKDYKENQHVYNFDKIQFDVVVDANIEKERFKKGDLSLYSPNPEQWYSEFGKNTDLDFLKRNLILRKVVFNSAPKPTSRLFFNTRVAPFDNPKVREAFLYLWNRDKVKELYRGDVVIVDSEYPLSEYQGNVKVRNYDPNLGNKMLEEAGYNLKGNDGIRKNAKGERLEFDVMVSSGNAIAEKLLVLLQNDYMAAGIKINMIKTTFSEIIKKVDKFDFKLQLMGFSGLTYPNPASSLSSALADQPGTNNLSGVKNSLIDELISKYNVEIDAQKRIDYIKRLDEELNKNVYFMYSGVSPFTSRFLHWRYIKYIDDSIFGYSGGVTANTYSYAWYDADEYEKTQKAMSNSKISFPSEEILYDKWGFNKYGYKLNY